MSYFVYILQSTTSGRYYIGCSQNVERRLKEHNGNKVRSTRGQGPYMLLYSEAAPNRESAFLREKQIKRYKGGNAFKKLIQK